ncbi:hypothetical protein NC651_037838 [Populus alba x Populus x berolinensis]|nr:hypothetical protein NC651_037838 [Populus alba x Populus x berolinensis]
MVYRRSAFAFFGYSIFFFRPEEFLFFNSSPLPSWVEVPCLLLARWRASIHDCATYTGSSRSVRSRSPGSERDDRGRDRKGHKDDARDESRRGRDGHSSDREERYRGTADGFFLLYLFMVFQFNLFVLIQV